MITLSGFLLWIAMLYLVTSVLWGIYATEQQRKHHYPMTSFLRYSLVFIINTVFMPVCMMVAICKNGK